MKTRVTGAIAGLLAAGVIWGGGRAGAAPAATLETMRATVVVGDLHGLLAEAAGFVGRIMPEMTAEKFAQMAGAQFGDPGLQAIAKGSGMAILVAPTDQFAVVIEVKADKAAGYAKALEGAGMKSAQADGFLILSRDAALLDDAKKLAPAIREKLLGSRRNPTIAVGVDAAGILRDNEKAIRKSIGEMREGMERLQAQAKPGQPAMPGAGRILEAEMIAALQIARQVRRVDMEVAPSSKGLRIESRVSTIDPAPVGPPRDAAKFARLIPGGGAMRMAFSGDMSGMVKWMETEAGPVFDAIQLKADQRKAIAEMMRESAKAMGDGWAFGMSLKPETGLSYAFAVRDAEAYLALMEKMSALVRTSGIDKFYESLGMKMEVDFRRNARKAGDVPIHVFLFNIETTDTRQAEMLKKFMGDGNFEIAIVDGYAVYGTGKGKVEELVAAVKAGKHEKAEPMAGEKDFGPGARLYVDYDFAALVAGMTPENLGPQAGEKEKSEFKKLQDALGEAPPVSIAAFRESYGYRVGFFVPGGLLEAFGRLRAGVNNTAAPPAPSVQ